jgi:hypothetical protein
MAADYSSETLVRLFVYQVTLRHAPYQKPVFTTARLKRSPDGFSVSMVAIVTEVVHVLSPSPPFGVNSLAIDGVTQ